VAVEDVEVTGVHELSSGDSIPAQARVQLGELTPNDVVVQLYFGRVSPSGTLINPVATPMAPELQEEAGAWLYRANGAVPEGSGKWGYTVRVLPFDADLVPPYLPGLVTWEQP
jgi:starch phosphorylase